MSKSNDWWIKHVSTVKSQMNDLMIRLVGSAKARALDSLIETDAAAREDHKRMAYENYAESRVWGKASEMLSELLAESYVEVDTND